MKKIYSSILMLLILLFFSVTCYGQEQQFIPLNPEGSALDAKEAERMNSLFFDLHPTAFVNRAQIMGEDSPLILELQKSDTSVLFQNKEQFQSVEMLLLKITEQNQLSQPLDLSDLRYFENLRYIIVECHFECSPSKLRRAITGLGDYKIFYLVSIPR